MHDFTCTDTDTATDQDTDTFILIGPCSDLCLNVRVNGWTCRLFLSLLVPFPTIFFLLVEKTQNKQTNKKTCLRSAKSPKEKRSSAQNWSVEMFLCRTKVLVSTVMRLSFPIFGKVSETKCRFSCCYTKERLAALYSSSLKQAFNNGLE